MTERVNAEQELLRAIYPGVEASSDGTWLRIRSYPLPAGWSLAATDVAIQIPPSYPGTPPYGIYVPNGLVFDGKAPKNYTEPASNKPPFEGIWGVFSWQVVDGEWRPTADPTTGTNLSTWLRGFAERFKEGA